jgi:hypothetical protein
MLRPNFELLPQNVNLTVALVSSLVGPNMWLSTSKMDCK